ncbi:uncharacterized protein LOC135451183 [Zonotrichia leucophrys gambelii]|uniref:uncharacterized protein LOC135451183 n=1 Tax=Zonotrichia leucophrys gambelii TaxID=257770 RepID=UPI00313FF386
MEAILEERITNCGISAAGRRRGALPTQVEPRQDRTEDREAGTSPECWTAPGAHPGSRGRGMTLPSRRRGRGEPGPSWGEPGQLLVRGTAGTGFGSGAAPGIRARLEGSSRRGARRGQRSARGQLPGTGLGSGAAPAGCGWRSTSLSSSSSSSSCARNPASHGGDSDRVRTYLPPTLGQPFVSHLFISYFPQPCCPPCAALARKGCGDPRTGKRILGATVLRGEGMGGNSLAHHPSPSPARVAPECVRNFEPGRLRFPESAGEKSETAGTQDSSGIALKTKERRSVCLGWINSAGEPTGSSTRAAEFGTAMSIGPFHRMCVTEEPTKCTKRDLLLC